MATRSNIIVKMRNGSFARIYCHWDGYPSYNGRILSECYATQAKAEKLIRLGNLSILAESPVKPRGAVHTFEKPADGFCVAYGRDRKEKNQGAQTAPELDSLLSGLEEYVYFWDGAQWLYAPVSRPDYSVTASALEPLAPVVAAALAEEKVA